jgi:hypothetical protein
VDLATWISPCLSEQRPLIVSGCVNSKVSKRASQPLADRESVIAVTAIALDQRPDQDVHLDDMLLSNVTASAIPVPTSQTATTAAKPNKKTVRFSTCPAELR